MLIQRTEATTSVNCNRETLALARRNAPRVAKRIVFENDNFPDGKIQDLQPLIVSESIDCAISKATFATKDCLFGPSFQ